MSNPLTAEQKSQLIADTEQHLKDGLITRREAVRKINEIKAR